MKILLIAGHGAGDPGACSQGYKESDLTRDVVGILAPKLRKYAEVSVYDTSKNAFAILNKGGSINFKLYDYVLEVHFNAFNGSGHGTEIYVTTAEKGVSVEEKILSNIAKLGFTNRGVKHKNWLVINTAKKQGVSAALLEVCFIDNKNDMALFRKKKDQIADAIVSGIADGFGLKASSNSSHRKIVQQKASLEDGTMEYLDKYKFSDALYKKLADAMK